MVLRDGKRGQHEKEHIKFQFLIGTVLRNEYFKHVFNGDVSIPYRYGIT